MEPLQWDMRAIKADKAHARTPGSRDVTVAVIDTGVDDTHPDIAPNFDRGGSANCTTGRPDTTEGAWRPTADESPHGTHVAGEIAGARNGVGITGVAPGVKVSGIKVGTASGFFYTEGIVCAFMWAADHGADVTNNSYFTDPWYFNCTADPDQKALVEAVTRASRYAERKGTVNVAAAANENFDLASHAVTDPLSPDDGTAVSRTVDPSTCLDIPAQLPGVVTVSATGAKTLKASYSNYGLGVIDITAPGGDSAAYQPPEPCGDQQRGPRPGAGRRLRVHGRYVHGGSACRRGRGPDRVPASARLMRRWSSHCCTRGPTGSPARSRIPSTVTATARRTPSARAAGSTTASTGRAWPTPCTRSPGSPGPPGPPGCQGPPGRAYFTSTLRAVRSSIAR